MLRLVEGLQDDSVEFEVVHDVRGLKLASYIVDDSLIPNAFHEGEGAALRRAIRVQNAWVREERREAHRARVRRCWEIVLGVAGWALTVLLLTLPYLARLRR